MFFKKFKNGYLQLLLLQILFVICILIFSVDTHEISSNHEHNHTHSHNKKNAYKCKHEEYIEEIIASEKKA